jgi:hypothetical protein
MNLGSGYAETCSHKCGGVWARRELTANTVKDSEFRKNIGLSQARVWASRTQDEIDRIRSKSIASQRRTLDAMSDDERSRKFSRVGVWSTLKQFDDMAEELERHSKTEARVFGIILDKTLPAYDQVQDVVARNVCAFLEIEHG